MKTGRYQIDILHEGTMSVDGGIAFAGLPKSEWQQLVTPDSENRIKLGLNQLLIRGNGINMLVDAGLGTKMRPRRKQLMGIIQHSDIEDQLATFNLKPEDITHVVFTHLHYDHCGGATRLANEESVPVFKNAVHIIQKNEWKAACNPDEISRTSYYPHDFLPLSQSGQLQLINGDFEVAEGIFLELTGGHTAAHQLLRVEDEKCQVVFPGDICPTPWHLNPESREAFDLFPCETLQIRKNLIFKGLKQNLLFVFSHGLQPFFLTIY
ncbi:MAG: MBL fold metallo-hydrolase, partial [Candidatus Rifleibacteriota bacterium]